MRKSSKPWLSYKSDASVREYPKKVKTKRYFKWALFWLFVGGHIGAHRLYLWEGRKAGLIMVFYFLSFIAVLVMGALFLPHFFDMAFETHEKISIDLAAAIPWFLIIIFEFPRLKHKVNLVNKKHLLA